LDKFKIFKAEVDNKHDLKIKIVRSDRGGEYYGRHTPYGQVPGSFARFLQENGIVAQYSTPGKPQQNGYGAKHAKLLYFTDKFVDGGIKTAAHNILNQVPSKSVPKTPYELWTSLRPTLNYLHMWGCPAEAKVFNLKY
jgi:hypothetical protein